MVQASRTNKILKLIILVMLQMKVRVKIIKIFFIIKGLTIVDIFFQKGKLYDESFRLGL